MARRKKAASRTIPLVLSGIALAFAVAAVEKFGHAVLPSLPFLRGSFHETCPAPASDDIAEPEETSEWAPWTHRPYCAGTKYCVFTKSTLGGNKERGISIITTEGNISRSVDLLEEAFASQPARTGTQAVPWTVEDVPDKGKGVVATHTIRRGEAFMVDPAAVMAAFDLLKMVRGIPGNMLLATAIDQLPNSQAVLSLARSNKAATSVAEDVVRTNTFAVTLNDERYMALFPDISVSKRKRRVSKLYTG